jgi:hypothetical protein
MKVTKWIVLLCVVVFIAGIMACGGGKYADAKKVMEKSNKVMEDFLEEMEKAENAKEVAAVLTDFTKAMQKITPEMKKLEEKYPELAKGQSPPPELGEIGQRMAELWSKFASVMMKMQKYADDPEVQKAQEELQNIFK